MGVTCKTVVSVVVVVAAAAVSHISSALAIWCDNSYLQHFACNYRFRLASLRVCVRAGVRACVCRHEGFGTQTSCEVHLRMCTFDAALPPLPPNQSLTDSQRVDVALRVDDGVACAALAESQMPCARRLGAGDDEPLLVCGQGACARWATSLGRHVRRSRTRTHTRQTDARKQESRISQRATNPVRAGDFARNIHTHTHTACSVSTRPTLTAGRWMMQLCATGSVR